MQAVLTAGNHVGHGGRCWRVCRRCCSKGRKMHLSTALGAVTKCGDGLTKRKVDGEGAGVQKRGLLEAAMECGQTRKRGASVVVKGGLGLSYQRRGLGGERTRLVLASITPAYPWSFHTAQNRRDLCVLTGEQQPSPLSRPVSSSFLLLLPSAPGTLF